MLFCSYVIDRLSSWISCQVDARYFWRIIFVCMFIRWYLIPFECQMTENIKKRQFFLSSRFNSLSLRSHKFALDYFVLCSMREHIHLCCLFVLKFLYLCSFFSSTGVTSNQWNIFDYSFLSLTSNKFTSKSFLFLFFFFIFLSHKHWT